MIGLEGFSDKGFAEYEIIKKNSDEVITMCVFNNDTHVCIKKELYEELQNYMKLYDELATKTGMA